MRVLLDTHAFLWFVWDDARLSIAARELMADASTDVYLSVASAWEIAIKTSLNKLALAQPVREFVDEHLVRNSIRLLPIELAHVAHVSAMPLHHRDPFDRLIAAQALIESVPLVSADQRHDPCGVERRW